MNLRIGFRSYRLPLSFPFLTVSKMPLWGTSLLFNHFGKRYNNYLTMQSLPVTLSKKKIFLYFVIGGTVWVLIIGLSFNHQRLDSPIVSHLMYQLKHSSIAQSYLGKNIDFAYKWPWVSGEINYIKGRINLSFRVNGSQDKATIKFKSIRKGKNSEWMILEWVICPDKCSQEISLLEQSDLLIR
ncbi:hypothetical protein PMAC_001088 [Pneumocystis sp. 'macacae']|nr:hypothetical protein PMAC_001088 [Pneumocystis sp. 'macacae']